MLSVERYIKAGGCRSSLRIVDDDGELEYMSKVFAELMSDLGVDIRIKI